jgi:adenylate cyclase
MHRDSAHRKRGREEVVSARDILQGTQSRFSGFVKTLPKGVTALGIALHLLNLPGCFLLFIRFGLLVDAASIFIILSAVMGCFLFPALLRFDEQARTEATPAAGREGD